MNAVAVPQRFVDRVVTHCVAAIAFESYPLMLGIQGPSGVGKSFQVRQVLDHYDFATVSASAATLSGQYEKDSVSGLEEVIRRAQDLQRTTRRMPVILIEDLELSPVGQTPDAGMTVNSQLLAGFMMHLADDSKLVGVNLPWRIPVIVTGNDFTVLHAPLTRPGRMDVFTWEPDADEMAVMVQAALRAVGANLDLQAAKSLVRKYPRAKIATFAAAVSRCLGSRAYEYFRRTGVVDPETLAREVRAHPIAARDIETAVRDMDSQASRPSRFTKRATVS